MEDTNERAAPETSVIEGTVIAKLPEFGQIAVRADDKSMWALTDHLRDFTMEAWSEGQRVRCTVTDHPARVLSAEAIPLSDARIDEIFAANHNPEENPWTNYRRFARAVLSAHEREAALGVLSRLSDEIGQELGEPERKD